MRFRIGFLICFTLVLSASLSAQTRSVTNTNLDQYKQDRLKAEREYRENYERMGFPSSEELDRRREQGRIETEQLSAKLRAASIERERVEAERLQAEQRANAQFAAAYNQYQAGFDPQFDSLYNGFFYSASWGGRRHGFPIRHNYLPPGYFAGGQFWPTGASTPPRPLFVPSRH